MKPAAPTVDLAVRTARGERRRIRSFLKQVEGLGVEVADLPPRSVKALDEAEKFLGRYLEEGILKENPFQTVDRIGVGRLIKMAVEDGRATRPDLEIGVCGEHGGDPSSIEFFNEVGLNYVSCSPFRVPVARLAAAQAQIAGAYSTK